MIEETVPVKPLKRKLHLNFDADKQQWSVKKAFGFYPEPSVFAPDTLREYLKRNPGIDVVLRYV